MDRADAGPPAPAALGRGLAWATGVAGGLLALGPGLQPGSLLNLDLILTPTIPVPAGVWGLGSDPPRRVPLGLLFAWGGRLTTGPAAGKVILLLCVASAIAGTARLLPGGTPRVAAAGAGLLYGLSPFALTRLSTGQWGVLAAAAVLPWAVPTLLHPSERLGRTLLWSAALGATGIVGGLFALSAAAVGVIAERRWTTVRALGLVAFAQLPWIVPGVAVVGLGHAMPGRFATRAPGVFGSALLLAGQGFWRPASQVGRTGLAAVVLGVALAGLAAAGAATLPASWRTRGAALGAAGLAMALASALPGVRTIHAHLTASGPLAAARDGQRFMPLALVWLMPAAAAGAARLARSPRSPQSQPGPSPARWLDGGGWPALLPLGIALALGAPALADTWTALRVVHLPASWAVARSDVRARPGPVLALPWHEYMNLTVADGRRVLNPLPDYLGGDVISSTDPELGPPVQEAVYARLPAVGELVRRASSGAPVAVDLSQLQIRWVVVLHDVDWRSFSGLPTDPGLDRVVSSPTLDLYAVRSWSGPVLSNGTMLAVRSFVAPVLRVPSSGSAVVDRAAKPGWLRGLRRAGRTPNGRLALPAGRGLVWYWPALATTGADVAVLVALLVIVVDNRRACRRIAPLSDDLVVESSPIRYGG
jgi:hypothetical protein